jgi:hypothetical protein
MLDDRIITIQLCMQGGTRKINITNRKDVLDVHVCENICPTLLHIDKIIRQGANPVKCVCTKLFYLRAVAPSARSSRLTEIRFEIPSSPIVTP